jgi:hypothetical protein
MARIGTPPVTGTLDAEDETTEQLTIHGFGSLSILPGDSFDATLTLEKAFAEDPSTWIPVLAQTDGTAAELSAPGTLLIEEPEHGVRYRARVSAYASGTIAYRLAQA